MNIKLLSIGFLSLFILGACSPKSDSPQDSGVDKALQEKAQHLLSIAGTGSFKLGTELPANDTSRFTIGCKEQGSFLPTGEYDKRLGVGFSFRSYGKSITKDGYMRELLLERSLTSTDLTSPANNVDYETLLINSKGMGKKTPLWLANQSFADGTKSQNKCKIMQVQNGTTTWMCLENVGLGGLESQIGQADDDSNCRLVSGPVDEHKDSINKGVYIFPEGKSVEAYREINESKSTIECDGKAVEKGTQTIVSVTSNKVPALDMPWIFCGGSFIKHSLVLKGDSGKIYYSIETEILGLN